MKTTPSKKGRKPNEPKVELVTYGENNEFVKPSTSDLPPINLDLLTDVPLVPTESEREDSNESSADETPTESTPKEEVNSNRAKHGIESMSAGDNWVNIAMSKNRNLILEYIADEAVFVISLEKVVGSEKDALNFNPFQLKYVKDKENNTGKVRVNMLLSKEGFRALMIAFGEMVETQNLNLED
jgi:hypothetical protein